MGFKYSTQFMQNQTPQPHNSKEMMIDRRWTNSIQKINFGWMQIFMREFTVSSWHCGKHVNFLIKMMMIPSSRKNSLYFQLRPLPTSTSSFQPPTSIHLVATEVIAGQASFDPNRKISRFLQKSYEILAMNCRHENNL